MTGPAESAGGADAEQLKKLGYAQELRRRMGAFSNFAISFSTICILAGGITSLQLGVEWIYHLKLARAAAHSPAEDAKVARTYANAYIKAKGPQQALVRRWIEYIEKNEGSSR